MFPVIPVSARTGLRTISTVSRKFLVYAPDKENSAALRYKIRAKHFEAVTPLIQSGVIKVAGMMITPDSIDKEGQDREPVGSMLIVQAESLEKAQEIIQSDIYYTSGLWDRERLVRILVFFLHRLTETRLYCHSSLRRQFESVVNRLYWFCTNVC